MSLVSQLVTLATRIATELNARQQTSARGQANGYAALDATGKVPAAQLPAGGGGVGLTTATVTVDPAQFGHAAFSIAAATATAESQVLAVVAPNAEHDADDLDGHTVCVEGAAGAVTGVLSYDGPIVGTYRILYAIG